MLLRTKFLQVYQQLGKAVLGQEQLVERLLISLLADGHLLVEGAPGLAKTRAIQAVAQHLEASFARIQFTPDLLPADLTGTEIFNPATGEFKFRAGPLMHNLILADEINRAPAKVQSALLEAMAERQISVGGVSYKLPQLFLVMATQNPLEQEGTYPLPEAQLDRFLMHNWVSYPSPEAELAIMRLVRQETLQASNAKPELIQLSTADVISARQEVLQVHLAEPLERYIVDLVQATRRLGKYDAQLADALVAGASPRASLALDRCARALAWLQGRTEVQPEDIQQLAPDILRHRLTLSYSAAAQGLTADSLIQRLLRLVALT